ncbi:unnamed protein product [Coregonus sp. 'balchen']|nr:unnamed protein product [Coregonus sp. 'balchen']
MVIVEGVLSQRDQRRPGKQQTGEGIEGTTPPVEEQHTFFLSRAVGGYSNSWAKQGTTIYGGPPESELHPKCDVSPAL